MQRKPFLSIDDILGLKPSRATQYCTHSRRCCTETSSANATDHTENYVLQSQCDSDKHAYARWQSPSCYTGYSAPYYNRKSYWQQYYIRYGAYASQLYLQDYYYKKQQRRRMRASFTHEQVLQLQKVFQKKKYLGNQERAALAQKINMTEQQIKIWFQNRRYKEKKQLKNEERANPPYLMWKGINYEDYSSNDNDFESHTDIGASQCIEIV